MQNNIKDWSTLLPWLQLYFIKGLGSVRITKLVNLLGSPTVILNASPDTLQQYLTLNLARLITQAKKCAVINGKVALTHAWLNQAAYHCILCPDSKNYPQQLRQLYDYPPILFLSGNADLLQNPQLAIVGSRRPTFQGKVQAEKMAFALAEMGLTITSGMASGIDAVAHGAALTAKGKSIAVIGTGIDRVYPAKHQLLAQKLIEQGLIVSEFPLGSPPVAGHFPRRNRIISGLSLGVLVAEAAEKSGSLITARLALEQNKEVFVIPGAINNLQAKGCNRLIQQGAMLVDEPMQIIQELRTPLRQWLPSLPAMDTPDAGVQKRQVIPCEQRVTCTRQLAILKVMGNDICHIDELLLNLPVNQEELSSALTLLEIEGIITQTSGGYLRSG